MGPPLVGVARATELFDDPEVRAQVRAWHLEEMPLLEMVDRLDMSGLFDPELRAAIAGLGPDDVKVIRQAFMAAIDEAGKATTVKYPVDCSIDVITGPVSVSAGDRDGQTVVVVTPAKTIA
jgi:hypothetical protein